MEERIAELNRQSMEARSKLLQLIEQQKLVGLTLSSSPVSPVESPLRAWTGGSQIHDLQTWKYGFTLSILKVHIKSKEPQGILCSSSLILSRRSCLGQRVSGRSCGGKLSLVLAPVFGI